MCDFFCLTNLEGELVRNLLFFELGRDLQQGLAALQGQLVAQETLGADEDSDDSDDSDTP